METIVCKFGGTCAAGAEGFKRIRNILESDPRRRYAVLSAPGAAGDAPKVTDLLYRLWANRNRSGCAREIMDAVAARFAAIALALGMKDPSNEVRAALTGALRVSRAQTVSRGEYLCAKLFSRYAGLPLIDAARVMRFDGDGRPDAASTRAALLEMSRTYPRAVLPGFYGADPAGHIALFPRNGSDITGALVAAGVGADLYENWTDVPGLMTDDPAANPDARLIPEISYAEMRRRAGAGARVLHPDCLAPVEDAGIPTMIRCIFQPDRPGTRVFAE